MGLAQMLGFDAVHNFIEPRRNMLLGASSGFLSGDLGNVGRYASEGKQADDAWAVAQKAEADRQQAITDAAALKDKYAKWFMDQGQPKIAQGIADGIVEPGAAYMEFITPKAVDHPASYDEFLLAQQNPDYAAHLSTDAQGNVPSGYRVAQNGNLEAIPGGPADPAIAAGNKPPTEAQQRAASLVHVVSPELAIIEKHWGEIDNWENQAMGGKVPGTEWAPLQGFTSSGNQQAQNALKTIISSYLYAISGATANPGEVANNIDILTPKMGDKPEVVQAKKARVRAMVEAIAMQAKGGTAQPVPGVGGAGAAPGGTRTTSTGVTYTVGQ